MGDGNMVAVQRFAKKHILVAVTANALVERMLENDVATNEQVGCVQMLVGSLLALVGCVAWLLGFLVAVAQQLLLFGFAGQYGNTAIDHRCGQTSHIALKETGTNHRHIAVYI